MHAYRRAVKDVTSLTGNMTVNCELKGPELLGNRHLSVRDKFNAKSGAHAD